MKKTLQTLTVLAGVMTLPALTGCDGGEPAAPPTDAGRDSDTASLERAAATARAAADSAAKTAGLALEAAREAVGAAAQQGDVLADAVAERAREMTARARGFLNDNNLDSAAGIMARLEAIKDRVPAAMQAEIEGLRQRLDQARETDGPTPANADGNAG